MNSSLELRLKSFEAHVPTVRELQQQLNCSWQTAKHISREMSAVLRAMQKGAKLLMDEAQVRLSSTGKCISEQVIDLIKNLFGFEVA